MLRWRRLLRESLPAEIIFFFQAEDGIRDLTVTGVQTCALPIWSSALPLPIQGKSRMRQSRSYGSVRGVRGNSHPYRDIAFRGLSCFVKAWLFDKIGRASCRERV